MKLAKVLISREYFEVILKAEINTKDKITTNAPSDLKILGFADKNPYTFFAICESETFADIPEGADPPELLLRYTIDRVGE